VFIRKRKNGFFNETVGFRRSVVDIREGPDVPGMNPIIFAFQNPRAGWELWKRRNLIGRGPNTGYAAMQETPMKKYAGAGRAVITRRDSMRNDGEIYGGNRPL